MNWRISIKRRSRSFLLVMKNIRILLPVLISCISFLLYLSSLHHQFVFDDFKVIVNNPFIKDWKHFPALFHSDYFKISGELSYRPVVTLSYFMDYAIWQLNPLGFHLTNLFIHTLNTSFVFLIILQITKNTRLAGISCLFFGIHPILTETVSSVGFREDLLCFMFFLLTIFFYTKLHASSHKNTWYAAALIAYSLSLFSKEMAISLPLVILVLDPLFLQSKILLRIKMFWYYMGFFLVTGAYLLLRVTFLRNTIEYVLYPGNSIVINVLTMTKVIASYIKLLFFPMVLNADYHVIFDTSMIKPSLLLSLALLGCIAFIAFKLYHRQKEITFSILWTFITLIPVMNIVPLGNIMAERYLYMPSLGFCIFLGILIIKILIYVPHMYRNLVKTCFIAILLFYLTFTIKYNRIWSDEGTLWSYTVHNTSCSFNAHNNLGKDYFQKGLTDKAIEEYTIALLKASEVQYKYPIAHYNLGLAYDTKGMYDASIREYRNALCMNPGDADAHNNLGIVLFITKQTGLAVEELGKAITLVPNNPAYHTNLAKMYRELNMPDKAGIEQDLANRLKHSNRSR